MLRKAFFKEVSFKARFNVCEGRDLTLFLLFKEEGVSQGKRMLEEIKKLEEAQSIWNREVRGRMIRNEIRELEGSQIRHGMISHTRILTFIPRIV